MTDQTKPMDAERLAALPDSYLARIMPEPNSGCWIWVGRTASNGYGVLNIGNRRRQAHRVVYEYFRGPIPEGLEIDHLCRVHPCVNPGHLEAVTHAENMRRGMSLPAQNSRKTHCTRGHELFGDNLRVDKNGRRSCRTCTRDRQREAWALRKGKR